jgi:hypothetical protein
VVALTIRRNVGRHQGSNSDAGEPGSELRVGSRSLGPVPARYLNHPSGPNPHFSVQPENRRHYYVLQPQRLQVPHPNLAPNQPVLPPSLRSRIICTGRPSAHRQAVWCGNCPGLTPLPGRPPVPSSYRRPRRPGAHGRSTPWLPLSPGPDHPRSSWLHGSLEPRHCRFRPSCDTSDSVNRFLVEDNLAATMHCCVSRSARWCVGADRPSLGICTRRRSRYVHPFSATDSDTQGPQPTWRPWPLGRVGAATSAGDRDLGHHRCFRFPEKSIFASSVIIGGGGFPSNE